MMLHLCSVAAFAAAEVSEANQIVTAPEEIAPDEATESVPEETAGEEVTAETEESTEAEEPAEAEEDIHHEYDDLVFSARITDVRKDCMDGVWVIELDYILNQYE
jgi:hypothetical protein